jgi:hypothetical protein
MAGILIMGALGEFDKDQKKVFAQGLTGLDTRLGEVKQEIAETGFVNMGQLEATRQVAAGILKGNEEYIRNGEITEEGFETLREWFGDQAELIAAQILVAGEAVRAEQARTVAAVVAGDQRAIDAQLATAQQLTVTLLGGQQVVTQALTLASGETVNAIVGANGELTNQVILAGGQLAEIVREGDVETIRLLEEQAGLTQDELDRLNDQATQSSRIADFVSTLPGIESQSAEQVAALIDMIAETIGVRGDVQGVIEAILNSLVPGQQEANRQLAELAARELVVEVTVNVGGEGFQHGGIVRAPTLGIFEGRSSEAVIPLNRHGAEFVQQALGGSSEDDGRRWDREISVLEAMLRELRRRNDGGRHGIV